MTLDQMLVLAILAAAIALFVWDAVRVDVVALLVLIALVVTGLLTPEEAFSGFANTAVVTVWSVFIISGALNISGVADLLARLMLRLAGHNPKRLLAVMMLIVGGMSAFMNNIGAVAILLPAVVSLARKLHISPSKLLMPLAFAALLGGNMTLIGTPPNILAANLLADYAHVPAFGFFDFLPMGTLALGTGIIYMLLIGHRLLPERMPADDPSTAYAVGDYLAEAYIGVGSSLIGQTVSQTQFGEKYDLQIVRAHRGDEALNVPVTDRPLEAGDVLLLTGAWPQIMAASKQAGISPLSSRRVQDGGEWSSLDTAVSGEMQIVEATLSPRSQLVGQTLRQIDFRKRFGVSVLAVRQNGRSQVSRLGDIPLNFGDSLLLQGTPDMLALMQDNNDFLLLDAAALPVRRQHKMPLALTIIAAALTAATAGWLPVSVALLSAAVLLVLTGVLTMDEAYKSIDWKAVFLIAGMLPLGVAMGKTGTARFLADQLIALVGGQGPLVALGGLFLLTALLTEVISNAAATVLMVPIAIDTAVGLGFSPQTFVMATVLAASTSFLMPVGHQVNVIIYGPGGYKFTDYARVGVGLNLLMLLLTVFVLPLIWPL